MFNNYKYKFEVGPTLNFKINKIVYVYNTLNDTTIKVYEGLDSTEYFHEYTDDIFIPTDWYSNDYIYSGDISNVKYIVNEGLNYRIGNQLTFIEQMGTILNFNVKCYDETWVFYKVLLDFIENFAVGDVFINEG